MINDILSRATEGQPVPEVGMGATILMASDRHAATIVEVFGIGKAAAVKVRRDIATVVSGLRHDGSAEYAFERDPEGVERTYKFDGVRWREIRRNAETGRWIITDNTSLRIGSRSEYYDPSF